MTMDVSRLGIVVESTGIKEAATALQGRNGNGGLAGAAAKAEKNVATLVARLGTLSGSQASATTAALAAAMGQLGGVMAQIAQQAQATAQALNQATAGMNNVAAATNNAHRANAEYSRGSHVVMNTLKALATVSTVYAAINVSSSIIKQADAWQMMTARLQNATGSLNNAKAAQEQMYDLSQRLRVPLEDSVKLYTRLAPAIQRMGKDSGYAKDMVEGIATALQLGGANGAEASSVMLQLSQSFSSGVLNGAEFNAVAENGSVLMRALEKSTGMSTYQLKKLGSEGKLSMKTVGDAIQANLPLWREQFDKLPLTFEGGVQRIKNAWTKAVGEMGQDTGFNQELSKSLRTIEDMIPSIARGMGEAFIEVMKWIKENRGVLGQIWDQIIGITKDVWKLANAFMGMLGYIVSAGESVSVIALLMYTARGSVYALIDVIKLIGASFVDVGISLAELIIRPFQWGIDLVTKFRQGLGEIARWLERTARIGGFDNEAKAFGEAAKSAEDGAKATGEFSKKIDELIDRGRKFGDSLDEGFRTGKTHLQQFIDGTDEVSVAIDKAQKRVMDANAWGASGHGAPAVDAKAAKAAEREQKRFEDALVQAKATRAEQEELNKRLNEYGLAYEKLGPAQKKVIELTEQQVRLEKDHASAAVIVHNVMLLKVYEEAAAWEKKNEHIKESLQLQQKILDAQAGTVKSVTDEADKAEAKVAAYDQPKGVDQLAEIKRLKESIASLDSTSDQSRTANLEVMIAMLNQELDARNRIYDAETKLGQLQIEDQFEKLMDPKKAEKFGDVLANGFGKAGKALGELIKGMQSYEVRMSKVKKAQELADKQTDPKLKAKEMVAAAQMQEDAWVTTYADMAGAAKGFFDEGSRGYKAMQAVEQGFRMWQMAMQVKSFLQEIGLINAVTTTKVMSETVMSQASLSASETRISAAMAEGQANALTGIANQAKGDPYSAFFRMAAMAAVMAALGFAVGGIGGGGGQHMSQDRQASQGTGTVLGDDKAKSESISKSLEYLSENSDIALRYSSGMLHSLQNIEESLTGAVNGIVRTGAAVTGKDFMNQSSGGFKDALAEGIKSGLTGGLSTLFGGFSAIGRMMGFGSSTKLLDSGITSGNQSVGDILSGGFDGKSYQDVQKSKSFLGMKYSSSTSRTTGALDPQINAEFTQVIEGMVGTLVDAADLLGFSGEEVEAKLKALNLSLGDISLKGLSTEEIQKQLEAVFSSFGDKLAGAAFGDAITKFQQAGEGLLETAVRVASGVEQADYELEKLGLTAIDFRDIINVNGDVAAEIVRQSIMLTEQGSGIGEIINQMSGSAGDIAAIYKDLVGVRDSLQMLGIADDVTRELIRAAGGLDAMKDALESYTDNFFSEAEKNAMQASALTKEFDKLGLTMPVTKQGFRDLVEQLSATGADGQALAMKVLLLSGAFSDLMDNSTAAIENARNDLSDAYDREAQALSDTKDKFEEFAKSLGDFKDSLLTGDLSTENPLEKYMLQKAKYEDVAARAAAGDETAMAEFQNVAQAFLEASRDVYASGDQYTEDFMRVLEQTQGLEQDAQGKASVAQQQLDALNAQVSGLLTINESVLTVAEAIANLNEVLALGLGIDVDGSHANGLANVPYDGYVAELHKGERVLTAEENRSYSTDYSQYGSNNTVALVEEIKALRQEVCSLRDGQREQTGALIAANYDASARNAETVVEGHQEAARTANYSQRAQAKLA